MDNRDRIYCQFETRNACSLARVLEFEKSVSGGTTVAGVNIKMMAMFACTA